MAIDDNTNYTLTGAQVKDLAARIKAGGSGMIVYVDESFATPSSISGVYSDSALSTPADPDAMANAISAGGTVGVVYDGGQAQEYIELSSVNSNNRIPEVGKTFTSTISTSVVFSAPTVVTLVYNGTTGYWSVEATAVPTKTSDLTNDGSDGTSTYVEADELATVATSGLYSDLTGRPSTFTGATSSVAGSTGLVPAPAAGDQGKVLTGGGSWTNILNVIYPVGAIYLSTNNTSPATLFGGTWEQITDKFILAAGSTYGAGTTGGSATINLSHSHTVNSHNHSLPANTGSHTLTTSEIPSHAHDTITMAGQTLYTASSVTTYVGGHSAVRANYSDKSWERKMGTNNTGGGGGHSHSIGGNTGDKSPGTNSQLSSTQSILPPYLAVYVWKRTA
jgi:hypothetical protein